MKLNRDQARAFMQKIGADQIEDWRDIDPDDYLPPPMPQDQKPQIRAPQTSKLEIDFAAHLELLKRAGAILNFKFNSVKVKIAEFKCWYMPDFLVMWPDAFELVEVKGHWEEDALIKFKVAATLYPEYRWCAVQRVKGVWQYWRPWTDGCRKGES